MTIGVAAKSVVTAVFSADMVAEGAKAAEDVVMESVVVAAMDAVAASEALAHAIDVAARDLVTAGGLSAASAADPLTTGAVDGPKTFSGTVLRCGRNSWGYDGFITPDDPDSLPEHVIAGLAKPRSLSSPSRGLYFRRPNVGHQKDFELGVGVAVTFQVYVDDEGAGACDVSPA